jgi:DNA-binding LacI/PurR family transcriptional regulator
MMRWRRGATRRPADLSTTGYADMPFFDRAIPPLAAIRIQHYIQHYEMGVRGANLLLERLADPGSRRADFSSSRRSAARLNRKGALP